MPFYEYRCDACGHELEALQKLSDQPLAECPACGRPTLKKLISAGGFRLKGGGWYETDFKGGGKKNLHEAGGEKKSGTGEATKSSALEKKADTPKKTDTPKKEAKAGGTGSA